MKYYVDGERNNIEAIQEHCILFLINRENTNRRACINSL
jgi:hypothetical protein